MQAEEIPNVVSYRCLLEVLEQKPLIGYTAEERIEFAHLMQCLRHLQSEAEYKALLAAQLEQRQEEEEGDDLRAVLNCWKRCRQAVCAFWRRARRFFCIQS